MSGFQILTFATQQALDNTASVLNGATMTFSLTGTSNPTNAYADKELTIPLANPLSADSAGNFVSVFLNPAIIYRVVLKTQAGVVLKTWDPANEQLLSQAIIGGYLYPITADETSGSVTPLNYAYPSGDIRRYGAIGDGVIDDTGAMLDALNAVGSKGLVKLQSNKIYKITQQLLLCRSGSTGPDGIVCDDGVATLKFSGLSSSTDCILIGFGSDTTRQPILKNLIIDAQGTAGRDIISVRRDEHGIYENLYLKNAVRDAFSMCPQADFDQVENPQLTGVHVERAGRHGFACIVGVASTVGPFVNEVTAINCEVRGYSWLVAGGAAFYYQVSDNHGGAGIQDHTWIGCNVNIDDGQGAPAHTPAPGVVYADYDAAGSNIITHIDFYGGGWETSNASVIVKAARHASIGNTTNSWHLIGQNVYNLDGVTNAGVDWEWDQGNARYRNGFDYRVGTVATQVLDPGATGSVTTRLDRSGVTKGQIIPNNEFGQAFWDVESALTVRRYSDALSVFEIDATAGGSGGFVTLRKGTAIPGGGNTVVGYKATSTANFGVFFGSGAPTLSAAKGSLYLRSDGTTTNNRAYINTDGGTTWTAITTVA